MCKTRTPAAECVAAMKRTPSSVAVSKPRLNNTPTGCTCQFRRTVPSVGPRTRASRPPPARSVSDGCSRGPCSQDVARKRRRTLSKTHRIANTISSRKVTDTVVPSISPTSRSLFQSRGKLPATVAIAAAASTTNLEWASYRSRTSRRAAARALHHRSLRCGRYRRHGVGRTLTRTKQGRIPLGDSQTPLKPPPSRRDRRTRQGECLRRYGLRELPRRASPATRQCGVAGRMPASTPLRQAPRNVVYGQTRPDLAGCGGSQFSSERLQSQPARDPLRASHTKRSSPQLSLPIPAARPSRG